MSDEERAHFKQAMLGLCVFLALATTCVVSVGTAIIDAAQRVQRSKPCACPVCEARR